MSVRLPVRAHGPRDAPFRAPARTLAAPCPSEPARQPRCPRRPRRALLPGHFYQQKPQRPPGCRRAFPKTRHWHRRPRQCSYRALRGLRTPLHMRTRRPPPPRGHRFPRVPPIARAAVRKGAVRRSRAIVSAPRPARPPSMPRAAAGRRACAHRGLGARAAAPWRARERARGVRCGGRWRRGARALWLGPGHLHVCLRGQCH